MLWKKLKKLLRKNKPKYLSMSGGLHQINYLGNNTWAVSESSSIPKKRKVVKPVEVFKQILREVPSIDVNNIDKKIKIVKDRM